MSRCPVDGPPDPYMGPAPAQDTSHRLVDLIVIGLRISLQERGGGHDLPGLAIPTLRNVLFDPRTLDRVISAGRQPFDRGDFGAGRGGHGHRAGANGGPLGTVHDVDGARSAQRPAATILGSG
jgi:hypothetical protein